jgi:hypothetical protein
MLIAVNRTALLDLKSKLGSMMTIRCEDVPLYFDLNGIKIANRGDFMRE